MPEIGTRSATTLSNPAQAGTTQLPAALCRADILLPLRRQGHHCSGRCSLRHGPFTPAHAGSNRTQLHHTREKQLLSLQAQGQPTAGAGCDDGEPSTPARAGTTVECLSPTCLTPFQPCACRDNAAVAVMAYGVGLLSLQMQGADKTTSRGKRSSFYPPRMQGQPPVHSNLVARATFTPAFAGTTHQPSVVPSCNSFHPCACRDNVHRRP